MPEDREDVLELSSGLVQHSDDREMKREGQKRHNVGENWEEANREWHPGSHMKEAKVVTCVK